MSINQAEVKKQVEYYFSDKNLVQDKFFTDAIQASENGFLNFDLILKCKKIQKLGVTSAEQLASAIADSSEVELNESKNSVRRIGNKPLPVKDESAISVTNAAEKLAKEAEKKEMVNFYESFQPIIFTTACTQEGVANWKNVSEALLKQHSVNAPYCRFSKHEGNFAINKETTAQEVIDRLVSDGLQIGENQVTIKIADEEELKKFWELHGRHYSGIMEQKIYMDLFKLEKETHQQIKANKQKKERKQRKEFEFGGEKYTDILTIKNLFKGILGRTANGQKIISPYHDMLKALLAYHEKGESKLENLDHFTVDIHPEYKDTRCFFAVKTDGTREDFSAVKCIANLEQKMNL